MKFFHSSMVFVRRLLEGGVYWRVVFIRGKNTVNAQNHMCPQGEVHVEKQALAQTILVRSCRFSGDNLNPNIKYSTRLACIYMYMYMYMHVCT